MPQTQRVTLREVAAGLPYDLGRPGTPAALCLESSHPNPFNGTATLRFTLEGPGDVELVVTTSSASVWPP